MIKKLFTTQLGQNILTNYISVAWMALLSLALIPVYLKKLGQDQWAIVAICMSIQAFLGLLDAGLGQIMPRDMAQAAGDKLKVSKCFSIFSRIYVVLAVAGFLLGQAAAGWLAHYWVRADGINTDNIEWALRFILVQFLFQFANNAHTGYWNGLQKQKTANIRQCIFGTFKHSLALFLVFFWRQNAFAYLAAFATLSFLEWVINHRSITNEVSIAAGRQKITMEEVSAVGRQVGGLAAGILIGMLVSQMDKIVLSRTVPLSQYGIYVIVANLGVAFMQLQYPLLRAFLPRVAREALGGARHRSTSLQMLAGILVACILPCLVTAAFAPVILEFWIHNVDPSGEAVIVLRLILAAVAINALYGMIYLRMVSDGYGKVVIYINLVALFAVLVVVASGVAQKGISLGGVIWVVNSLVQLSLGLLWLAFYNKKLSVQRL